ncbi:Wsp signal transduction system regulator diguanylate cyclase WspR [soil metagenome]
MSMHGNFLSDDLGREHPVAATVLLVDDQPVIGMVVRKMLSVDAAITFHVCMQASEAIDTVKRLRPTVILQDLVMPGADGLELLRAYRSQAESRDTPIIVLSSNDDPAVKKAAFTQGANDYMVKLPEPIELVARIRYHSRSYMALIQRDNAYRALRLSQEQLLESNLELRRLTNSDGLTGLANRRYFNEYMSQEWAAAEENGTLLSLLMIDVDFFTSYNDRLGHLAGDDALQQVARTIDRARGDHPASLAARFGGEEFALVLPGIDAAGARKVAENLRLQIESLAMAHPSPSGPHLTVSVGAATVAPTLEDSPNTLIERADAHLYQAKCNGRNRVSADDQITKPIRQTAN